MSRPIRATALAALLFCLRGDPARADLSIMLTDVTVAAGNIGTVDIYVLSNGNSAGTGQDTLSSFGLGLQISPVPGSASFAQFTTTQPDPTSNPNYVFSMMSFNANNGLPFFNPPSMTVPDDTIQGGDEADPPGAYATIPAAYGQKYSYLASVSFQTQAGAPAGDEFQITLSSNPGLTYFDGTDANQDPLTVDSVSGGLITLSAAVPEPSSLAMTLAGIAAALGYRRARRAALAR